MAEMYDTMMTPQVEDLMAATDSKFGLCTLASTRAREINSYFGQLGDGLGGIVMPECRLTVHGNDVFYYGMFKQIGQDKKNESYYVARWNSTIDFSKGEAPLPEGADAP